MVEVEILEQLINSLEEAIKRLESAFATNDLNYIHKLRVFIFTTHQKIEEELSKNV